jgi:hypothetical protein
MNHVVQMHKAHSQMARTPARRPLGPGLVTIVQMHNLVLVLPSHVTTQLVHVNEMCTCTTMTVYCASS